MQVCTLLKNGTIVEQKRYKKSRYKKQKVRAYLIECKHPVFGIFYVAVDPDHMRMLNSLKSSVLSYSFLDGILVDPEEDDYLFVKNKYWYKNPTDMISKIVEIYINELIFNDSFWVYDSFYQYVYNNLKLKVKTSKRTKVYKGSKVYDKTIGYKSLIKDETISIKNGKYYLGKTKNAFKKCFTQLYPNVFFRIDSKIFSYRKYKLTASIYLDYDNSILNKREETGDARKTECLAKLLESYISKYVIRKLEHNSTERVYDVKTKVKLKSAKYKFKKFMKKYFVDIMKC